MTDKLPRSGANLAFILGAVALLFLAFAFGLRIFWFGAEAPLPTLLQNLPESQSEADQQVFQARLQSRFPSTGRFKESDIVDALRRDGFNVKSDSRLATYDRAAGLNDKCRRGANIHWSTNEGGALTGVTGGYYVRCPEH